MIRRTVATQVNALGEDEVEVIVSTDNLVHQDGMILVPQGCVLDNYRRNPIWLWSHDPEVPIGRAEQISVEPTRIVHRVRFAPFGISPKADEIRGLVKSGIVSASSIGFEPLEGEPVDPKRPQAGRRITRWELFECSFVSVPADPDALVTARAQAGKGSRMAEEWKVGAARNLPIEDSDDWDGPAAAQSIFEHAGGDDFDPTEARRGFLVYDAGAPKLRGSYKLPIAHAVAGELKVPKGAIRAAASRLPQTDIPDEVKDAAGKVLDGYKKTAGIADDEGQHGRRPWRHRRSRIAAAPKLRGMYGVGQLAYLLDALGWAKKDAEIEATLEGDDSKVPAMLQATLQSLGDALVAMTAEEVAELVGHAETTDVTGAGLADDEIIIIQNCQSPAAQAFRTGFFAARAAGTAQRAGKALSAANAERLADVERHQAKAMEHQRAAVECHEAIGDAQRGIAGAHEPARAAHEDLGNELGKGAGADLDRCLRAAKTIGRSLDAMADHNAGLGDEHEALGDAHRGVARSIRAANRCLRDVDGHDPGADDDDSEAVQDPDGVEDDEGARSLDYRRRQAEKLRYRAA